MIIKESKATKNMFMQQNENAQCKLPSLLQVSFHLAACANMAHLWQHGYKVQ